MGEVYLPHFELKLSDRVGALDELEAVLLGEFGEGLLGHIFEPANRRGAVFQNADTGQNLRSLRTEVTNDRENGLINAVTFRLARDVDQVVFLEQIQEVGVDAGVFVAAIGDFDFHDGVVFGLGDTTLDLKVGLTGAGAGVEVDCFEKRRLESVLGGSQRSVERPDGECLLDVKGIGRSFLE